MNVCECPMCQGENEPMGVLGVLLWYRCQYCGLEYNIPVNETEENED